MNQKLRTEHNILHHAIHEGSIGQLDPEGLICIPSLSGKINLAGLGIIIQNTFFLAGPYCKISLVLLFMLFEFLL